MLFRRRNPLGPGAKLRQAVWPTRSWKRSSSYFFKRVLRLSASPHAIAAGVAAGVFASFTPFVGFHFVISFIVAFLIGGNILAAAFGTAVGNPLTFPAIWISCYNVGSLMLGMGAGQLSPHEIVHTLTKQPFDAIVPLLWTMVIGGLPLGLMFGAIAYAVIWWAVVSYQRARRRRLAERRGPQAPDGPDAQQESS
jgi:uncharacterized protein (DUF2062 family)